MRGEPDDQTLLRGVAVGDESSLAALYERHAGWLLLRMSRRCASTDIVDQALQDTFLALWRQAARYRGDGPVSAFIWGIGIRRLIDSIRRNEMNNRAELLGWLPWARADLVQSAEEEVLLGIEHGLLGPALARLSPELRSVMQATVLDDLTYEEAGRLLGVPVGTVKSRCHRARLELREALMGEPL